MTVRFPNLGLSLGNIPGSISIAGFEITIYGILIMLGMLWGMTFIILEAKRQKENPNLYLGAAVLAVIGGVIGARFYYLLFSGEFSSKNLLSDLLNIRGGGLAIYGGIFGGMILLWIFAKISRHSFGKLADTLCLGLLLAQIVGVWGNLFNRESFGGYTDNLLAMQLPYDSVNESAVTLSLKNHLVEESGGSYIQVHPLFLYESLWCLLLFLILIFFLRHRKYEGEIFLKYLVGYSLLKIFIEALRTDKLYIPGTYLPVSLMLAILLFGLCLCMTVVRGIMARKRNALKKRRKEARYAERHADEEEDPHKESSQNTPEQISPEKESDNI